MNLSYGANFIEYYRILYLKSYKIKKSLNH